jgi:glycopeptide antibiotics resistance protein
MNFFIDSKRFKTFDTLRFIYLFFFITTFFLTEAGRYIYRPYVYENGINDFGIADSMGNLGGIVVQIFFGMMIINPFFKKGVRLIIFFVVGYIVYEILQPYLPKGTFDWLDVYGTLVGGLIAFGIFSLIHLFHKKHEVIKTD